jgi:predicted exporter
VQPRRQKLAARVILLSFTALCVLWLVRLDFSRKISTNVLDLLPGAEQSPEAALVRSLAGDAQARVVLLELHDESASSAVTAEVAQEFCASLLRSGTFDQAVPLTDESAQNKLGAAIFERRFSLLLPTWLAEMQQRFDATAKPPAEYSAWLAETAASELESFLAKPEALPMQELVQSDPLLLVATLLDRARDLAPARSAGPGRALVWGLIHDSPLSELGQKPVFTAINLALGDLKRTHPAMELRWTGVNRFAAASRERIEGEFAWLNVLSLAAVLAVGCVFVRRVYQMLHLVPVILISLLGAWTVSTLVFDRVHILVFVIGSLLSGVAIDYGFYIYMQPSLRPGEPYREKIGRLLKPLLASCLTTVIGFSLLMFSDLPLLREVGFFVGVGLLCALSAAILYFAQLERPFLETRRFGRVDETVPKSVHSSGFFRKVSVVLLIVAAITGAVGLQRLRWRDDIHDLEIPSQDLHATDTALREAFGDVSSRTAYITHGATVAEARQHLADFLEHARKTWPNVKSLSLGTVFPTEADWLAQPQRLKALAGFGDEFRGALGRHGFDAESFEEFFTQWARLESDRPVKTYADLYRDLQPHLAGPLALLYRSDGPLCWFLTLVDTQDTSALPAALHTVPVNQLESLNGLFTRYRWSALRLSLVGLAMVIVSVFVIYRGRAAVRIALIPAGSCFIVFGLFGVFGQTLNLFHLLGAFLGVCLSHNYAIFSSTTGQRDSVPPLSIRISALCTAASFGVLGLSHIPVIHGLGLTVALIVTTALVAVELGSRARRPAV